MRVPGTRSGRKAGSEWLRRLDFTLGIPLLRLLSIGRRRGSLPETIGRVAVIKADGMGDLVLLTAILHDLKIACPEVLISLWCGGSVVALAEELSVVSEVHKVDFLKPWSAWKALRDWRADVIINLGQWSRSEALLAGMGRGKFTIGFETKGQNHHALYDAAVWHSNERHELENFRALLGPLGIAATSPPHIVPKKETICSLPLPLSYVAFHLWPSGVTHVALKQWPDTFWAELAENCHARGFAVALTGGPQDHLENERWLRTHQLHGKVLNAAGLPMAETTALLKNACAVVSVNTGVMHLAAALGGPTIGLHGPTNVKRWGPVGPKTAVFQVPQPDGAYLNLGFEYPADALLRKGIETIPVWEVLQKLHDMTIDAVVCPRIRAGE